MNEQMEYIKPLNEFEKTILKEINEEISNKYDMEGKKGKWVLFFPSNLMNAAWEKSCQLYHAEKLPGIKFIYMCTSKASHDPRSSSDAIGAIRFACGPSDDEDLMMEYGRALVDQLSYSCPRFGFISYKTEELSALGTPAAERKINHIYQLEVPKRRWLGIYRRFRENDNGEDIVLPSSITTLSLLYEPIDSIPLTRDSGRNRTGCWKMVILETDMDEVWSTAVQLYRQGKFNGVQGIFISTAMKTCHPTKVILFSCLPGNAKIIKKYGRNILKYMAIYNCRGRLTYLVPNAPGFLMYQLENWEADGDDDDKENTDSKK